jgi:hypothetical protein
MSKEKKQPSSVTGAEHRGESGWPPLTDLEEEVCLFCLRFYHGDWDQYLDYLSGPRVSERQRRRQLPVVARLKERDRRTDFLTAVLEDELITGIEHLDFDGLYRLWDLTLLLNPAADPFDKAEQSPAGSGTPSEEPPASLH